MHPPGKPHSRSVSRGERPSRRSTACQRFGANEARVSRIVSPTSSFRSSQDPVRNRYGEYCEYTDSVVLPGGAKLGSVTEWRTQSRNGSRDGSPHFASSHAFSKYSRDGQTSIYPR